MTYKEIISLLASETLTHGDMFHVLKMISRLVNDKEYQIQGRDLVIRVLARRSLLGEFEKQVLQSLLRTVGLFPYMSDALHLTDDFDRLAYELHRPEVLPEVFHSLQARVYHLLRSGANVVLSASTSSGKSIIIDAIIALNKFKNIVVIVPTLALIDETRKRLITRFGNRCRIITHPSQTADQERTNVYILTQERVLHREDLDKVDFVVVDEFYKIDFSKEKDFQRAVDLNIAFHRLASRGAQFYMLGPNIEAIRGLQKYDIHFINSKYTTVAADIVHFNLPNRGDERSTKLLELCNELNGPILVYCQSPGSASRVAAKIASILPIATDSQCRQTSEWLSENFHPKWAAAECILHGVGIHHGSIPRSIQQHMVRLFNQGAIRILVCTSTLIEGVNTVAENVIIYDRRRGKPTLDYFTYRNIQGRAGRMGRYFVGKIFVLEGAIQDTEVAVEYPIDTQTIDTPLSLLLQLEEKDLTPLSQERIGIALADSFLSKMTIKLNSFIPPDAQNAAAKTVFAEMRQNPELYRWRQYPDSQQLDAACKIIMQFFSGPRINNAGVGSKEHLAWYLRGVSQPTGVKNVLDAVVQGLRIGDDPNKKIDQSLGIIRNIIMFRFPQDLMALSRIQAELAQRLDIQAGDYGFYAESLENMFLPPSLAALDEYGIPYQLSRKLARLLAPHHDFDDVLGRLKTLNISNLPQLTEFEKNLILDVQSSI